MFMNWGGRETRVWGKKFMSKTSLSILLCSLLIKVYDTDGNSCFQAGR